MKATLDYPPAVASEKRAETQLSQEPPFGLRRRKTTVIAAFSIVAIAFASWRSASASTAVRALTGSPCWRRSLSAVRRFCMTCFGSS